MSEFKDILGKVFEESAESKRQKAEREEEARQTRLANKLAAEKLFDERVMPSISDLETEVKARGLTVLIARSSESHANAWVRVEIRNTSTYRTSSWTITAGENGKNLSSDFKMNFSGNYDSPIAQSDLTEEWVQERLVRLYKDALSAG